MNRDLRYELFNGSALLTSLIGGITSCKVSALTATVLELIEDFRLYAAASEPVNTDSVRLSQQDPSDPHSAHMLCLQGDSIAAMARFQLLPVTQSTCRLLIDQVYTHNQHYHCHHAYTILEKLLTLVQQLLQQRQAQGPALQWLSLGMDSTAQGSQAWLVERIMQLGFVRESSDAITTVYSIELDASSATQYLSQIIAFIQERKKSAHNKQI